MSNYDVDLVRYMLPDKTVGLLRIGGFEVRTLELPWKDNQISVSCIPDGIYPYCVDYSDNKGRNVIELRCVPNRSQIQIHYAKDISWLKGCIGVPTCEVEKAIFLLLGEKGFINITTINNENS